MWADQKLFIEAWEAMLLEIIKGKYRKISIFISNSTIDSVVCAKILANLLIQYSIPYSFYTTAEPYDLLEKLRDDITNEGYSALLINCGGTSNMRQEMHNLNLKNKARIFIIDAHRPICHQNLLSSNKSVIVFMPDEVNRSIKYYVTNIEKLETKMSILYNLANKSEKHDKKPQDLETAKTEEHEIICEIGKLQNEKIIDKINLINEKLQIFISEYYNPSRYWGVPGSYIAIKLLFGLNKARLDDIWYAIVGYTEFYLNHMMSEEMYNKLTSEFKLMIEIVIKRKSKSKSEDITGTLKRTRESKHVKKQLNMNIQVIDDLRLPLLSWWTLHDAAINSDYISGRLHTWMESGIRAVESMLVKIGFPQPIAKRSWCDVSPNLKVSLHNGIGQWASKFNIPNIKYKSFFKYHNWKKITASDVVYAVSALIACQFDDSNSLSKNNYDLKYSSPLKIIDKILEPKSFWNIWNALDLNNDREIEVYG